ncbi:MAG: glycoside hydrolase family 13 protein [Clostridia bacterium]|nr:glycoside hydrolase family 13 protein [Clostridia bacterium]
MHILFDSRNTQFKKPYGCLPLGETFSVTVYVRDAGESGVLFLLEKDGEDLVPYPMTCLGEKDGYTAYTCSPPMTSTGLFFYHFEVLTPSGNHKIFRDRHNRPTQVAEGKWQLTCFERRYSIPDSFAGRVMYQIFPDRFCKSGSVSAEGKLTPYYLHENLSDLPVYKPDENGRIWNNDFFGGNLQGIIDKLPYLKDLGITMLYLNPIFKAFSNHRYDTADYLQIDPLLGTNEDFRRLCDEAHKQGMKVMLDGVFSHTGSDSIYFDIHNRFGGGAYHDPASPYRSWFQFHNYPHEYASWWGIDTLPCTEEKDPAYMRYILTDEDSVIRYWLRQGADCWRLDVADELPDEFLFELYKTVKTEKPESMVLGEVWEDASNKISYGYRRKYLQGECLDGVMNYVWRDAIIHFVRGELSSRDFHESVMTLCEHYPKDALNVTMNLLSTHDTPRILTVLGIDSVPGSRDERAQYKLDSSSYARAKNRLISAAFLLFSLPGCPCIYYGDEISMEGFEDPFNRAYMGDREGNSEITACYRELAAIKTSYPALRTGGLMPAFCEDGIYAFYREEKGQRVFCMVNLSKETKAVPVKGEVLFARNTWEQEENLLLLPYGCVAIHTK